MTQFLLFLLVIAGVPRSHTIKHTHTHARMHPMGLLRTSNQFVADAAAYTTLNGHKRQISMHSTGFEPAIPKSWRPQAHALNRRTTEIGLRYRLIHTNYLNQVYIFRILWLFRSVTADVRVHVQMVKSTTHSSNKQHCSLHDCRIPHEVDENCALLAYCAASSGKFVPTFRYDLSVQSSSSLYISLNTVC